MPISLIPQEFIDIYDLAPKVKNGYVYMEIRHGMYGLLQLGTLANKILKERLAVDGYFDLPHTPGLFKHETPSEEQKSHLIVSYAYLASTVLYPI